ncbi:pentatricopeptide repeat-containing protein [Canna indica]|uniref:Pentatricopeptide repeat-containing protein n=1 Tax=Canna indica TaxID=4628 RepID=A0AAQ3K3N5_9LILI|nr:pentatricopeptide repeat-containing protein [Canna indica]
MLRRSKLPSHATISSLFKSLSSFLPSTLLVGLQIHALGLKLSISRHSFAGSALVHFYSKARLPLEALNAFDEIPDQDEVCYGALIVGLAQNHCDAKSLSVFAAMRSNAVVSSTMYSVSGALRAAAHLAALEQSRIIHAHAIVCGLVNNLVVSTALVDSYGKSGMTSDAWMLFDGMLVDANLVMWNAMLSAYAHQGDTKRTMELFNEMLRRYFQPDEYTFIAVLTACSNAGLAEDAERWIYCMSSRHGVVPGVEHYTCLVGSLARVGRLAEAELVALTMPCEPDAAVWRTLLSGSVVHRAAGMAKAAGHRLLELDPRDDSAYVMLANMYSSMGKKNEADELWSEMKDRKVKKEGGRSWIEVRGEVHIFIAGDRRHKRMADICAKLKELMEEVGKLGYKEMDEGLQYHSERLAMAFGVVSGSVPQGKSLRVVKNLRICGDCHEFFKYVCRVIEREIVVRDANRYHIFQDGFCSCKDCW